ncbi:hypothetical protein ACLB2K_041301 [Fragaria x ananassa]
MGAIHGAHASSDAPSISHLLFVDDSLVFAKAKVQEITNLKQILLLYEAAAGQKINFDKTAIAFELKEEIVQMLRVSVVPFHKRYLGLPTVAGRNKKEMFRKMQERLDSQLNCWNSKLLSKAGKMTLIKAVAQGILNYSLSVFKLPKGVLKMFQSKIAKFCVEANGMEDWVFET